MQRMPREAYCLCYLAYAMDSSQTCPCIGSSHEWLSKVRLLSCSTEKKPHQIKPKHTIDQYNPDSNLQTVMPCTSLPNMVSDHARTIEEFQCVLLSTSSHYKQPAGILKQCGFLSGSSYCIWPLFHVKTSKTIPPCTGSFYYTNCTIPSKYNTVLNISMEEELMTTWGRSTSLSIVDHILGLFDPKIATTPIFFFLFFPNINLINITNYSLEITQVALNIVKKSNTISQTMHN